MSYLRGEVCMYKSLPGGIAGRAGLKGVPDFRGTGVTGYHPFASRAIEGRNWTTSEMNIGIRALNVLGPGPALPISR